MNSGMSSISSVNQKVLCIKQYAGILIQLMMQQRRSKMSDHMQFAVCMAYDAFRVCLGIKPTKFTKAEIIKWIKLI